MKIDINGAPGVGVDAEALKAQEERLLGFTKQTSDFVKKIKNALLKPTVLFVMITFIFILAIEILWGSYFKTQYSNQFANDSSKLIRAMIYFTAISITIIVFGIGAYFFLPYLLGDEFEPQILGYIIGVMIFGYFINALVTGLGGAPTYTILGNFLAIK